MMGIAFGSVIALKLTFCTARSLLEVFQGLLDKTRKSLLKRQNKKENKLKNLNHKAREGLRG